MQAHPSTSNPQVSGIQVEPSKAVLQQPLVSGVQQIQASLPFTRMTQTYTSLVY